ncbi:vacuolar protein sorting-associated protein 37C [Odontesthes bonariensis]|uniref:vacuolar protein sorting-associated protein 37C n=1 Tax=Odontesthes bonariensis TaxID=219752 RepID=UPI003F58C5FE
MEKLQDLSQSELQELLDNPERVESMALESDEIQNIQLEREMALASNRSLAEQNLDMKPRLESQKEVLVARYSQLEAVGETYRKHCSLRDGMVGQVSPEALFSRLQTESSKTEAESEALADEFLEGSLLLDSFLERFLSLRSLALKRRVRMEKLQEMMRQRTEGDPPIMTSSAGASHNPASTPSPWNQTTATTTNQQQPDSRPQSCSYQNASPTAGGAAVLPYSQYPGSAPNPPTAAAAVPNNPASQFPPYPPSGSPFPPAGSFPGPRPAFGPPASVTCPYPTQPSFPAPHPGSAFGQYTPSHSQSAPAPYSASYSYGGYSYPARPPYSSSQSPTGRPIYRPGYGVPQQYS